MQLKIEILALCYICSLLQGCGFESSCSQIFFFTSVFDLGIANGAKVDLKLRLGKVNF